MGGNRVSLIPALDDPEKAKKYEKLVEKRNTADYKCYMVLRELLRMIGKEQLEVAFMKATEFDGKRAGEFSEEIEEALENRDKHNEAMLSLIAGE